MAKQLAKARNLSNNSLAMKFYQHELEKKALF